MEVIDENLIVNMYANDQLSAAQISEFIHISISKVVRILQKNNVEKRNMSEAITQLNITKFHKVPFQLKSALSAIENDLKITGIMLYWGEGAKTGNTLKLANSDPTMIRVFLLFMRRICGVDEKRIKMIIHIYPDQEKDFLESFWSRVANIELNNFYKTQILKGKKGTYKKKSIYGTATIQYSDKKLLQQLLRWIEDYKMGFLR
jgi:hypothetical protein